MSAELLAAIANAEDLLAEALPAHAQGKLAGVEHLFGITTSHRSRGIAQLLTRGVPDPFFIGQMQSASAYAHGLPGVTEDEKATSFAAPFWDAVGGEYDDAARQIAAHSRMTHNEKREHEDDFCYVAWLMHRYYLAPAGDAPADEHEAHEAAQEQRLSRWEEVLDGALDPRLDLCQALRDGDAQAFGEAIVSAADARAEDLKRRHAKRRLTDEDMAWLLPIWPEGLALLRLAQREGLVLDDLEVPWVPPVIRVDNPYRYDPDAWRVVDFRPARRTS